LAGGPVGKVQNGDLIEIIIDRVKLEATVDLIGETVRYSTRKKAQDVWRSASCVRTLLQIRSFQMTPGSGLR